MVSCSLLKWWIQMYFIGLTLQISPTPTVVNPCDNFPCRAGARPWWGKARLQSETKSLFCSPCRCQSMCSAATAFKCIWSKRAGMPNLASAWFEGAEGRKEGRRGERRLACHCIIPAAINSLCPGAEWTRHSNGATGRVTTGSSQSALSSSPPLQQC